jgi:hypothetical protein
MPLGLKPFVEVELTHKGHTARVLALLDSGADVSLFHASLAPLLGIDVRAGLKQHFTGIAGQMEAYFHEVELMLVGLPAPIQVAVAFGELAGMSAILGQADFFQHHQITFERYNERIEINPV